MRARGAARRFAATRSPHATRGRQTGPATGTSRRLRECDNYSLSMVLDSALVSSPIASLPSTLPRAFNAAN